MHSKKTLFLFTDSIEYSFAQTEFLQLSRRYSSVIVVVAKSSTIELPHNVKLWVIPMKDMNPQKVIWRNKFLLLRILFQDILGRSFNLNYYLAIRENLSYLVNCFYYAEQINRRLKEEKIDREQSLFLSFWFNAWAISLGILKRQNEISCFFSRTHGIDLFENRVKKTRRIPFRLFQLQEVTKVFSVSKNGEAYLKQKYPQHAAKIFCNYLGTEDSGENQFSSLATFTLVSCAVTRNIKRIFLIPEILKQLDMPIKWVHLGAENLNDDDPTFPIYLKNKESLKDYPNIQAEFSGSVSNAQIINFYKNNPVHLFISVSETEGLPVSIMEAISFGIPVIATDVGGCREIVNEKTGILIPKDFDLKAVAQLISDFKNSEKNTPEFRKEARQFWAKNFEVNRNYDEFMKGMKGF